MPVYEYECSGCKKVFEVQQKISEAPLENCPECGDAVKKIVSMSSFQLKGGGWYSDGYSGSSNGKGSSSPAPACPAGGSACKGCAAAS
ncbi:FmdB family zinc ribbon protein [Desulfogranum japonicum]|uniref:FmdB family zinc ribbon protein n=1 Tax=Desulfogranum japonicum TaxID=231447 RepID=UPI0003F5F80E|nr:zinc ribbon domain-containing protein [Desulfogranum japonicum]